MSANASQKAIAKGTKNLTCLINEFNFEIYALFSLLTCNRSR